jgi:hypothetical protein
MYSFLPIVDVAYTGARITWTDKGKYRVMEEKEPDNTCIAVVVDLGDDNLPFFDFIYLGGVWMYPCAILI